MKRMMLLVATLAISTAARAQAPTPWWPSEWGPNDERGAKNRITTEHVVRAARLITEGKVYSLGRPYEPGMPMFANRHYSLTIPGAPTGGPFGENHLVYNDELVSGEIGQMGTQFDGLGHVGTRIDGVDVYYNGFENIGAAYGLEKLGIQNVGPFFTRGVLLDVARAHGVERLAPGYIITVADIEQTLARQGVEIHEGDVVLFHTGHGQLWMKDNEAYETSNPGPGVTALRWLIDKKIVMTGADTGNVEAVPGENPEMAFEGHQWLMNRSGVYNFENLDLEALAADEVYEFAFVFSPVPFKGATGSPGNPIAVR